MMKSNINRNKRNYDEGKYIFCKEYSVFYDISKHIDGLSETDIEELRANIESLNPQYEKPKPIIRDYMREKIKNKQAILDLYNHISSDFGTGSALFVNIENLPEIRVEWKCEIHVTLNSYESIVEKYGSHEEIEENLETLNFIYLEDFPVMEDFEIPKLKVIGTEKYEDWLEIEPNEWYVVRDFKLRKRMECMDQEMMQKLQAFVDIDLLDENERVVFTEEAKKLVVEIAKKCDEFKVFKVSKEKVMNYSENRTVEEVYREFMYRASTAETEEDLTMHVCLLMPVLDEKLNN